MRAVFCLLMAILLHLLAVSSAYAALPLEVSAPSGFTKVRAVANCSLYRVEVASDYEYAPLLVYLTGSRYGEERSRVSVYRVSQAQTLPKGRVW